MLHIPAQETKSKLQDLVAEIPDDVARRLRWYRRHILPRLDADPERRSLRHQSRAAAKTQETLTQQFTETIKRRLGVHLTPHQFRHLGDDLVPRRASRGLRDAKSFPRACLEQDDPRFMPALRAGVPAKPTVASCSRSAMR